jgi:hypothetical protein
MNAVTGAFYSRISHGPDGVVRWVSRARIRLQADGRGPALGGPAAGVLGERGQCLDPVEETPTSVPRRSCPPFRVGAAIMAE